MLDGLRQRLTPQFITFVVVRLAGVGVKPLVLLLAGIALRERFANDYALLVSALAGLFVLAGAQTHIPYYNQRFSDVRTGYYHVFRTYFGDTLIQYVLVLPAVAAIALLWTHDPVILGALVLLVGVEKFFDEDMRHFQFTRQYYGWSTSFAFRTILPSLCVLSLMPFWNGRLIEVYTALSLLSLVSYGVLRHQHFAFYLATLASFARRVSSHGQSRMAAFAARWRQDLMYNQLWTFASINILLVDRLLVANLHRDRIDEYVFFANIFNLVNVAHSLFYFVPRRPELIKARNASAWGEIARAGNLLPPFVYLAASMTAAIVIQARVAAYRDISPVLFGGLALFYLFQAINQVGIEYVFWRVSRLKLVLCDGGILLGMGAAIYGIDPPLEWIPYITSFGLLVRMLAYQWIARAGAMRSEGETQSS
jgi:hypothetical protein